MILDKKITQINSKGNLLIDTRPWLDTQMMLTNWNSGIYFYLKINEHWEQMDIDPGLVLISDENNRLKNSPISQYLKKIPDSLKEQIKPFNYQQFSLLNILSLNAGLIDIFRHSPVLVWITIIVAKANKWSISEVTSLLQQKRECIIETLIGYRSKSVVRFMNKVILIEGSMYESSLIRESIMNKALIKAFSHQKQIPIQSLAVLRKYPRFLCTKLLFNEINRNHSSYRVMQSFSIMKNTIEDIENMAEVMEITLPDNHYHEFKHKRELDNAHDRLVRQFNFSSHVMEQKLINFPDCPIGDKDDLIQIKNSYELIEEGRDMHHCVGGYINQARTGQYYFYKVLSPERGTIQISVIKNKVSIIQFKLSCNKIPSEESLFNVSQILVN